MSRFTFTFFTVLPSAKLMNVLVSFVYYCSVYLWKLPIAVCASVNSVTCDITYHWLLLLLCRRVVTVAYSRLRNFLTIIIVIIIIIIMMNGSTVFRKKEYLLFSRSINKFISTLRTYRLHCTHLLTGFLFHLLYLVYIISTLLLFYILVIFCLLL